MRDRPMFYKKRGKVGAVIIILIMIVGVVGALKVIDTRRPSVYNYLVMIENGGPETVYTPGLINESGYGITPRQVHELSRKIAEANPGKNSRKLKPGDIIRMPKGEFPPLHTIGEDDRGYDDIALFRLLLKEQDQRERKFNRCIISPVEEEL